MSPIICYPSQLPLTRPPGTPDGGQARSGVVAWSDYRRWPGLGPVVSRGIRQRTFVSSHLAAALINFRTWKFTWRALPLACCWLPSLSPSFLFFFAFFVIVWPGLLGCELKRAISHCGGFGFVIRKRNRFSRPVRPPCRLLSTATSFFFLCQRRALPWTTE